MVLVIMIEEKLLERLKVLTHARGMMHQPIMITGLVGATIVCPRQSTETGMKLPCYCNKGFNNQQEKIVILLILLLTQIASLQDKLSRSTLLAKRIKNMSNRGA